MPIKKKSPLTSEEMIERMGQILKNGLNIGRQTEEERKSYIASLINHVSSGSYFNAFFDNDTNTIMIETTYFDPLLCIDVTIDSVYFLPLSDNNYYQAFMKVLEFIWLDQKKKRQEQPEDSSEEPTPKKEIPNFDYL